MKRLLVRLAGGYVGLGALAFALHRARYLGTSRLRDWTDVQSWKMEAQLTSMRQELEMLRQELRVLRTKQNRRPRKRTPVSGSLAA